MEKLRRELAAPPTGAFCNQYYFYQAIRPHYALPPAAARAKGIAGMFRHAPAYVYANDRIAGSLRGLFKEKDTQKAKQIWDSYGFCSFSTNADHFAPDYPTFLKEGICGTLRRLEEQPENPVSVDMKETLLGFSAMLRNYETAAREKGKRQIAEDLAFLQKHPPATFRQALQLVFLTYIAFVMEGRYAMAFGRMDQYLFPYFHTVDPEEATDLLACTFLKLQEHRWLGGDDVVNICIGGVTPTGEDATNPLSYCILEAVRRANIPGPNLSARFHAKTEERFYNECLKVLGTGLGYPAMMNDEVNIPALTRHGYALEDARDYCFVGCIENFIPGRQPPWSDGRFNVPLYLTE
ncbi:MAG: pyruvate formate lyase family protein, partial [Clostridia bacterium]|nr:pyruvate formate lyase family protein [Clostridia bacterium]